MSSDYKLWLTHNNESDKVKFPYLPSEYNVKLGSKNTTVDIAGLGEILVQQGRPLIVVSFSSFFPAVEFTGVRDLEEPGTLAGNIIKWKDSTKPSHLILSGSTLPRQVSNMFCTIDSFPISENGGDTGTIHFSLTLKEHREVNVRKVKVQGTAAVISKGFKRIDNREQPKTYTVTKGDCLYNISKRFLGGGERWNEIFALNRDIIKDANKIYSGQVLKLPS